MSNLPVPASAAHIQVLNGKIPGSAANATRAGNNDAAEAPGETFGNLLQSQILGLDSAIKAALKGEDKSVPDGLKKDGRNLAQEAGATEVAGGVFAPFIPAVTVPVVADVRGQAGDISSDNVLGQQADQASLQVTIGLDGGRTVKTVAADFAGSGKFSQSFDLARQSDALGENTKDLLKKSADVPQNINITETVKGSKTAIVDEAVKIADFDKLRLSGTGESLVKAGNAEFVVRVEGYNNVAPTQANQPAQLPSVTVERTVGAPGWDVALGQKLIWVANQTTQVADLHLNPPNLGPLEVRLIINNDQTTAIFVSNHVEVREAIESAIPRLREMLADNGLTLGNVSVGSQSLSQQQQSFSGNERQASDTRGSQSIFLEDTSADKVTNGVQSATWKKGIVDTFA